MYAGLFVEPPENIPPVRAGAGVDESTLGGFRVGVMPRKLDPEFPHELPGFAFAMKPLTELEVFFQNSSLFPEAWWPGFLSFQQEQGLAEDPGISDGAPGHRNARYCSA